MKYMLIRRNLKLTVRIVLLETEIFCVAIHKTIDLIKNMMQKHELLNPIKV